MDSHTLNERYARHSAAALTTTGRAHAWHTLLARGLYRLLVDLELAGGPPAPMGAPHHLCMSDAEARALGSAG